MMNLWLKAKFLLFKLDEIDACPIQLFDRHYLFLITSSWFGIMTANLDIISILDFLICRTSVDFTCFKHLDLFHVSSFL